MPNETFGHLLMSEDCPFGSITPVFLNEPIHQSFAYQKLHQPFLKLSVLKLDGSFFDVHVPKTATVAELKEAVEDLFLQNISWSHVWGHFCLCFKGHKLISDKACIRFFGIKDGDELHFANHRSINCEYDKRRSNSSRSLNRNFRDYEPIVKWNDYT